MHLSHDQAGSPLCQQLVPKFVSQGKVKVDCEFEGDVTGTEVVISERGEVRGKVVGERVIVLGKLVGEINGDAVTLMSSAHVEGDIQHKSLTIETGAEFKGRCKVAPFVA